MTFPFNLGEALRPCIPALLAALCASCAKSGSNNCRPDSSFTQIGRHPALVGRLEARAARARPNEASCVLASTGFQDLDQVLQIAQPKDAPPYAVFRVWTSDEDFTTYEAPLGADLAGMLRELCDEVVKQRASCIHTGVDGVWYLLQAPGGAQSAITWSPKRGTAADSVIDTFAALRAYVTSPEPLRVPALQTLYRETYSTYHLLGLFDKRADNTMSSP